MERRFIKRLDKASSVTSINADFFTKVGLETNNKLLPDTEINHVVSQTDVYRDEREESTKYRLIGTVYTLFHNTLYNTTGPDSLASFQDLSFRDRTAIGEKVLFYDESLEFYLNELDGWFGYNRPVVIDSTNNCEWVELNPKEKNFNLITPEQSNWSLMVTYPFSSETEHFLIKDRIKIVDSQVVRLGGREMLVLFTPIKHNLNNGDTIKLFNMLPIGALTGTTYIVKKIGLLDETMKDYAFMIPNPLPSGQLIPSVVPARVKRVYKDQDSEYYFRLFKRITEPDDYEVYPLTFSNSIYNDTQYQFVFNGGSGNSIDIELSGFTDNRGRPLTELFVTFIKTDPTNIFTFIKSGVEIPFYQTVHSDLQDVTGNFDYLGLSDIHRIHDGGSSPIQTHTPIEPDIQGTDNMFYGDIVEYNKKLCYENVIGDVYHRFNTENRVMTSNVVTVFSGVPHTLLVTLPEVSPITGNVIVVPKTINYIAEENAYLSMGIRQEGYYYKPHHQIRLKNWSNYIERGNTGTTEMRVGSDIIIVSGTPETMNIPTYSEYVDGQFLWRDLMSAGTEYMIQEPMVDIPFLNGSHYVHQNYLLHLRRQDPFGKYQLYYADYPKDPYGDMMIDNNFIYTLNSNVC